MLITKHFHLQPYLVFNLGGERLDTSQEPLVTTEANCSRYEIISSLIGSNDYYRVVWVGQHNTTRVSISMPCTMLQ